MNETELLKDVNQMIEELSNENKKSSGHTTIEELDVTDLPNQASTQTSNSIDQSEGNLFSSDNQPNEEPNSSDQLDKNLESSSAKEFSIFLLRFKNEHPELNSSQVLSQAHVKWNDLVMFRDFQKIYLNSHPNVNEDNARLAWEYLRSVHQTCSEGQTSLSSRETSKKPSSFSTKRETRMASNLNISLGELDQYGMRQICITSDINGSETCYLNLHEFCDLIRRTWNSCPQKKGLSGKSIPISI